MRAGPVRLSLAGGRSKEEEMEKTTSSNEPRTYEKPTVESEEVFETLALACAKADTQCAPPVGVAALQS